MLTLTHRSCPGYQKPDYRVLYVGRDEALLVALRKSLGKPQYHIVSCMDRDSAILFLRGDPKYDLLLFDVDLLGPKGLELARMAQSLSHRRRTPIIITANELTRRLEQRASKTEIRACITKTSDMALIAQVIIRLLERRITESE